MRGRSLLKEVDLTRQEFVYLVDLTEQLPTEKRSGTECPRLVGRDIALIFDKASTRTRWAFVVGAHYQRTHVTSLGPKGRHISTQESMPDAAQVVARMFDGIEFRGFAQEAVETLDRVGYCHLEDVRNNTANSLLVTGALLGLDVRIASVKDHWPTSDVQFMAKELATTSGAQIHIGDDVLAGVEGADFLYADVWASMGEPASGWEKWIDQLLPFQMNATAIKATGDPDVKFMHYLPALRNTNSELGRQLSDKWNLFALEVTDEVFESPASVFFDQVVNQLHTIKTAMMASLAG
jgi:ornithine carbamoyltransferase